LALVQQLSDEDKLRLKDELIAETAKKKLSYFQDLFSTEESERISMQEIQEEVNVVRREMYEARQKIRVIVDVNIWISYLIGRRLQKVLDALVSQWNSIFILQRPVIPLCCMKGLKNIIVLW